MSQIQEHPIYRTNIHSSYIRRNINSLRTLSCPIFIIKHMQALIQKPEFTFQFLDLGCLGKKYG